jgi:hypothetical protein
MPRRKPPDQPPARQGGPGEPDTVQSRGLTIHFVHVPDPGDTAALAALRFLAYDVTPRPYRRSDSDGTDAHGAVRPDEQG